MFAKFLRFFKSLFVPGGRTLNIWFSPEVDDKMKYLMKSTGSVDRVELTRRAFAVYNYLWERKLAGATIQLVEDGETKTLVLR